MTPKASGGKLYLILSCEHARNLVPRELQPLFAGRRQVLETHRGYDLGALQLAESLASALGAPLFASVHTRLVCDLNRSPGNPSLFSEFTRKLPAHDRDHIIQAYHLPHRASVEAAIWEHLQENERVLHVGVHTFTPSLDGRHRKADIGLLYDPRRRLEKEFCLRWQQALHHTDGSLRVRRNYPYRGQSDGLPRYLRKMHPGSAYAGVELEVNQRIHLLGRAEWRRVGQVLARSLAVALGQRLI